MENIINVREPSYLTLKKTQMSINFHSNFKIRYSIMILCLALIFCLPITGCKKLVEVGSIGTSVSSENIYSNDATAIGAITSLYAGMMSGSIHGIGPLTNLSCIGGLSSDELVYYNGARNAILDVYYRNSLTNSNAGGNFDFWSFTYTKMYLINAALESLANSTSLTERVKNQLLGEAHFMRAFYYFYLVNMYGDVPLVLSTDYKVNALINKTTTQLVYQQVITDLKSAQNLLSSQYLKGDLTSVYPSGKEERVRPTRWAATALLARTYLYIKDWQNAENQSSLIISNTAQFSLESLNDVFLKDKREAIWQLQSVIIGTNSPDATTFILPASGPYTYNPVYLSDNVIKSFEAGDRRKIDWVGEVSTNSITYYYPNKYKIVGSSDPATPITEYSTVFRLGELFLIRAEAKIQQNKIADGIEDLNILRERATDKDAGSIKLAKLSNSLTKEDALDAMLHERQVELFTEWGHRWFDLKRTNRIDEVMSIVTPKKSNGGTWKSYQQNYPISVFELNSNPNLIQVQGY